MCADLRELVCEVYKSRTACIPLTNPVAYTCTWHSPKSCFVAYLEARGSSNGFSSEYLQWEPPAGHLHWWWVAFMKNMERDNCYSRKSEKNKNETWKIDSIVVKIFASKFFYNFCFHNSIDFKNKLLLKSIHYKGCK